MEVIKLSYISLKKKNLRIFGISKQKSLQDFVASEKDVKNGNTRVPLALARIFDEDLLPEEGMQQTLNHDESLDDILKNIQHKQNAKRRKSSVKRAGMDEDSSTNQESVKLFDRKSINKQNDDDDYKFEDYKIVTLVGRGTFGKVYLVKNVING